MSRRARLPQSRRHIFVFDEDWDFLLDAYGPGTESRLGTSGAIREIIHAKVLVMRAGLEAEQDRIRARFAQAEQEETQDV